VLVSILVSHFAHAARQPVTAAAAERYHGNMIAAQTTCSSSSSVKRRWCMPNLGSKGLPHAGNCEQMIWKKQMRRANEP